MTNKAFMSIPEKKIGIIAIKYGIVKCRHCNLALYSLLHFEMQKSKMQTSQTNKINSFNSSLFSQSYAVNFLYLVCP